MNQQTARAVRSIVIAVGGGDVIAKYCPYVVVPDEERIYYVDVWDQKEGHPPFMTIYSPLDLARWITARAQDART